MRVFGGGPAGPSCPGHGLFFTAPLAGRETSPRQPPPVGTVGDPNLPRGGYGRDTRMYGPQTHTCMGHGGGRGGRRGRLQLPGLGPLLFFSLHHPPRYHSVVLRLDAVSFFGTVCFFGSPAGQNRPLPRGGVKFRGGKPYGRPSASQAAPHTPSRRPSPSPWRTSIPRSRNWSAGWSGKVLRPPIGH